MGDKAAQEATATIQKGANALGAKIKQCGAAQEGSLKDAKEAMTSLREDITKMQREIEEQKKKFTTAKKDYQNKEQKENNAHVEIKNAKEAAAYVDGPKEQVAALEADVAGAQEAANAIVGLSAEDLPKFDKPASVQEKVQEISKSVTEKAKALKQLIQEKTAEASKATPQTGGTASAKKVLQELNQKVDQLSKKPLSLLGTVKNKVTAIVQPKMEPTAEAIRAHLASKKLSGEEMFDKLADGDKVPEAKFCKLLTSLKDAPTSEVAKMICRKLGADGITKDAFMNYVVLYYKVVRGIAFTDGMDVSTCKTVRKADEGEVLEVLEGPTTDEANGMTRVRVKSCGEPVTEGWVTVAGSKGTAFLEKTKRPAKKSEPSK